MSGTRITYWHDITSAKRGWIVDIEDDDGGDVLSIHPSEDAARQAAIRQAIRRGVPLWAIDEHGARTEIKCRRDW